MSSFFITRRYHDNYQHYDNNDNDDHNNDDGGNCSGGSLVNWCKWCSSYAGNDVMAKMRCVKPTVDKIVDAGNVNDQATMICTIVDHPTLVAARALVILSQQRGK